MKPNVDNTNFSSQKSLERKCNDPATGNRMASADAHIYLARGRQQSLLGYDK